uniref:Ig-like domain-containing protein n=1 Tax=Dromaius novaehollandiae TaxID=8790 RepID=A0A8C4KG44_DRONO
MSHFLLPVALLSFYLKGFTVFLPQAPFQVSSPAGSMLLSASMTCRINTNTYIHWYHQRPGQLPERILYVSGQTPTFDDSSSNYLTPKDSGVYFCAYCTLML